MDVLHTFEHGFGARGTTRRKVWFARIERMPSATPVSADARAHERRAASLRDLLVVALAVTSGATDAIGFLALGSAFTSVMTGNLVLLGIGAAHGDLTALGLTATAIASFVVGAALGARLAGTPQPGDAYWPRAITRALMVQIGLFAVFAVWWWALGSDPSGDVLLPLLSLNAAALGLQSSAVQRFGVSGLSTTYLTGTLTTVVIRLTTGKRLAEVSHSLWILLGLVAGAAAGALLVRHLPIAVPLVQLGTTLAVLAVALSAKHLRSPR
jgi:uncharacterized membrane protein YoaK (UPF0700 family)